MNAVTPAAPLVSNSWMETLRVNRGEATDLVPTGPVNWFTTLADATTYATRASGGAAKGAQAILAAGRGYDVVAVGAKHASYIGSGWPNFEADLATAAVEAFHFEGANPSWHSGPTRMNSYLYGSSHTEAIDGLVGLVDGASSFHVTGGKVVAGLGAASA